MSRDGQGTAALPGGRRRQVLVALAVAAALGIPLLILQRYVAATRWEAILLVAGWFVVFGLALLVYFRGRSELRPAAATYAAILIGAVAIGYWTGFRDVVVDENVVVASARASGSQRDQGLATGQPGAAERDPRAARRQRSGPVELARGRFAGEDGHDGSGNAAVVQRATGQRLLTFADFDVDPGIDVDVYLVPGDGGDVSDRVDLGSLKGNVGDQQYEIPADADLKRYGTVVLWCKPFTVRIAVAQLNV